MPEKGHPGGGAGSNFDGTRNRKGSNFGGGRGGGDFLHNGGNRGGKGENFRNPKTFLSGSSTTFSSVTSVTSSGSFSPPNFPSVVLTSSPAASSTSVSENIPTSAQGMLVSSQSATVSSRQSIPTHTIVAVSVLLSFVLTIFAILLFFCLRWRRRRRSSTAEQWPPPNNSNTIYPFAMANPQMERRSPGPRKVALSFVDTNTAYALRDQYVEGEQRAARERAVDVESLYTLSTLPTSPTATHVSAPSRILRLLSRGSNTKTDQVSGLGTARESTGTSATPIQEVAPQMPPHLPAWDESDEHPPVYST
ncbi:hypothetical protein MVEN_00729300 [Mycena venus]|uniref:Uncharacterized protein n=1 Tax=Mycena venus TaxID=2733690 RepID=A0A8H6YJ28_9AGAR|nr:hypothetical protein MVEN_00729300 [Mycena venus]